MFNAKEGRWDPRTKILRDPSSLENWELLSLIFGTGVPGKDVYSLSRDILNAMKGISGILEFNHSHLSEIKGLGTARRTQLLAVSEITRRIVHDSCLGRDEFFPFSRILDTIKVLVRNQIRESFYLVNFSIEGRVLRLERISQGSLWEVGIYKRDIVKAVLDDASGYTLIAHNHPKHTASPSSEDINLYNELSRILEELDVILIDQWIFGIDGIHSSRYPKFLDPGNWICGKLPKEYEFLVDIHCTV